MVKKRLALFLLCAMVLGTLCAAVPVAASENDGFYHGALEDRELWKSDWEYTNYRIPGIVVTKKDTVIVYCEARTGEKNQLIDKAGDWARMDIFIQRSTDGGKTFGERIYIARGDQATNTACVNNPVMIVGNDNTLHMLYCKNYSIYGGGIWYRKSTDDGLTWSEERELSQYAESVPHGCFAFGPTHGICTSDGVLMTPVWLVKEGEYRNGDIREHGPSRAYVFYSKDNGETWELTQQASTSSGETAIAELSDGGIVLNSRATGFRKITASPNGISNWETTYADEQLPDPGCCGGLVAVNLPGLPYAHLFVNCANGADEQRVNVTVKCSFDDCVTYEKSLSIAKYVGGYCDIAVDSKGKAYVLYEISNGKSMHLATFSFVDTFVEDDPLLTADKTQFALDSEDAISKYVSSYTHLDGALSDGVLRMTANDTRKHSVLLDFSKDTKNLNLSDNRAMAIRFRVNTQNEGDFTLGLYFLSGRIRGSENGVYHTVEVPNDGEWKTVVVNLDDLPDANGMLRQLRVEPFSDSLRCAVGDTLEIAYVNFYASVDEANAALGISAPADSEQQTQLPDGGASAEKGCGSSVAMLPSMALLIGLFPIAWRRKRT